MSDMKPSDRGINDIGSKEYGSLSIVFRYLDEHGKIQTTEKETVDKFADLGNVRLAISKAMREGFSIAYESDLCLVEYFVPPHRMLCAEAIVTFAGEGRD